MREIETEKHSDACGSTLMGAKRCNRMYKKENTIYKQCKQLAERKSRVRNAVEIK